MPPSIRSASGSLISTMALLTRGPCRFPLFWVTVESHSELEEVASVSIDERRQFDYPLCKDGDGSHPIVDGFSVDVFVRSLSLVSALDMLQPNLS